MSGKIACQERGDRKIPLSYMIPLKRRLLWLKLYCLNSSCQLGPRVPLSQRWTHLKHHSISTQLSHMIWGMNQMPHICSHVKQNIINVHDATNRGPKGVVKLINGNAQAPKFLSQKYGAGALQVPLPRGRISGQVIYTPNSRSYCKCSETHKSQKGIKKLESIHFIRTNKPNYVFKRIYNLMLSKELFIVAYQNVRYKKDVTTPDRHINTPNRLRIEKIQDLISSLRDETFQFQPTHRIHVPKRNGKPRPLPVPSFNDKLIQEVMRLILEAIYEPTFSNTSHGFRKGRRYYTALKDIRNTFPGVEWLMTRDIKKSFDSFNHHKIVSILRIRISDQRFTNLVWKLLRANYMEGFKINTASLRGMPQTSIVSQILSNIYLNELDKFINNLIIKFYKGKQHTPNREYSNSRTTYDYWKNRNTNPTRGCLYLNDSISARSPTNKNYRRLHYVRYADDFLIGLKGTIQEAKQIKEQVNSFLSSELLLNVSPNKNNLTRASKRKIKFLGVEVRVPISKKPALTTHAHTPAGKAQSSQRAVKLKADIKNIINKLHSAGFCDKLGNPTPPFQLYHISHNDIILVYNKVLRKIKNHFRFADNFKKLTHTTQYILIRSCAKLLAAKLKMSTTKAVYKKYGKDLNKAGVKFNRFKSHKNNRVRSITNKQASNPPVPKCRRTRHRNSMIDINQVLRNKR